MKQLYFFFFLLIIISGSSISAQNIPANIGAAESGMGGIGVASTDIWSASNNQAALGFNKNYGAGFYYENRFMTKELSLNALTLVLPTGKGSFAANISYFGFSQYNEKKIGLAYGMALSKRFAIGVQLDYLNTTIGNNYGSKSVYTFEIGIMSKLTEDITLGVHVFNPIQAKFNDYNSERLALLMKLGLQWKLSDNFTAAAEVHSDINNELIVRGGLEYKIKKILYARIGLSNNPNIFSFGVGLQFNSLRLDFSSSMHQVLGYSPQLSLIYQFKK
ncbi:MAG: hypothetical protein DRI86_05805 [Bacteroidetes bacterium]|nr:MAG: hypothetical protein DRI86_05805 [Bacteroidota bacterium]